MRRRGVLFALLAGAWLSTLGQPWFAAQPAAGGLLPRGVSPAVGATFSVETLACPSGMSLLTLDPDACQSVGEPLVAWSIASDRFTGARSSEDATILGGTTIWHRLPAGTYFIDLTADRFVAGYGDYFIPSSNQVTRQDERTTRIYVDTSRRRESIHAYVFPQT